MIRRSNMRQRRQARFLLASALIAWWVALGGLWMLLVDTVSVAEVVCAVLAGLIGAFATRLVLANAAAEMRPGWRLLAGPARQLVRVPGDLWLLARELSRALAGRRRVGRFHEIALELPVDAAGHARRAGIELFGSLAPNTIVLGVDEQRVIVHQLAACHDARASLREIGS